MLLESQKIGFFDKGLELKPLLLLDFQIDKRNILVQTRLKHKKKEIEILN